MSYFKDGKALMDEIHRMANRRPGSAHDMYTLLYFAEIGPDRLKIRNIGTSTGRYSAPQPNMQNIPIRTEDGRRIKEALIGVPLETACDVRSEGDEYHCVRAKCHLRWDTHEDRPECPLLRKDY